MNKIKTINSIKISVIIILSLIIITATITPQLYKLNKQNTFIHKFEWGINHDQLQTIQFFNLENYPQNVISEYYFLKSNQKLCAASIKFNTDNLEIKETIQYLKSEYKNNNLLLSKMYGHPLKNMNETVINNLMVTYWDLKDTKIEHFLFIDQENNTIKHKINFISKNYEKEYKKELGIDEKSLIL
jgi:hypothetical protein